MKEKNRAFAPGAAKKSANPIKGSIVKIAGGFSAIITWIILKQSAFPGKQFTNKEKRTTNAPFAAKSTVFDTKK